MDTKRIASLLLPLALVAAACSGGEEPAPSPTPAGGPVLMANPPSVAGVAACTATESPNGRATVFAVVDVCDPGFGAGHLFVTTAGSFLLDDQTAWPAMVAAFDVADASEAAADLSLAWAAYQMRRDLIDATSLGWNADGTAWGFLLPTSGGEEDGVDVVTPYDARFAIAFDAQGNATDAAFVEMCLLPGDWPGSTVTVDAPACPTAP
ncbi:MAG: hypothetical protein ACKOI0_00625 [Actinomycetota bacterium]